MAKCRSCGREYEAVVFQFSKRPETYHRGHDDCHKCRMNRAYAAKRAEKEKVERKSVSKLQRPAR